MLLRLPPELIQLVFLYSTPTSYVQLALTCRVLFEIGSNFREGLGEQLCDVPGLRIDIIFQTTRHRMRWLIGRTFDNLYGVQFHADRKIFRTEGRVSDARASSFSSSTTLTGHPLLALAFKDDENVYVMQADNGRLTSRELLVPPGQPPGKIDVLMTAFGGFGAADTRAGLYVLQRFTPCEDDAVEEAAQWRWRKNTGPVQFTFLVHYVLGSSRVRICAFPDHLNYEPLCLATLDGDIAISWRHIQDETRAEVVLYRHLEQFKCFTDDGDESGKLSRCGSSFLAI